MHVCGTEASARASRERPARLLSLPPALHLRPQRRHLGPQFPRLLLLLAHHLPGLRRRLVERSLELRALGGELWVAEGGENGGGDETRCRAGSSALGRRARLTGKGAK